MIFTSPRWLFAIAAAAMPAAARAQPAVVADAPAADGPDVETAREYEVLSVAEQFAADAKHAIDGWIATQAVSEPRLFARLYFPVANSDPARFTTAYDVIAERDLVPLEDKVLASSATYAYAIVTDLNGYVPAFNSRYGDARQDGASSRSKRMFGDRASIHAGRSDARYLVQRTRLETGEQVVDLSVPLVVRGKHWGCVRIGFRAAD